MYLLKDKIKVLCPKANKIAIILDIKFQSDLKRN